MLHFADFLVYSEVYLKPNQVSMMGSFFENRELFSQKSCIIDEFQQSYNNKDIRIKLLIHNLLP